MSEDQVGTTEDTGDHRRGVVAVGVSTRSRSDVALRWAAEQAAATGCDLVVIRAWRPTPAQAGSRGTPSHATSDRRAARIEAEEQLARDVAAVLGDEHRAQVRLVFGGKRRTLVEASHEADLLVIEAPRAVESAKGPGFVARLAVRSSCPVVVVPRDPADRAGARVRRTAIAMGRGLTESAARAPRPGMGRVQPPGD